MDSKFIDQAKRAGAFGPSIPPDLRYHVSGGVGMGWTLSELGGPCIVGFYSTSPANHLKREVRSILKRMCKELRAAKYVRVIAAIEYRHPCFTSLLRLYQKMAGFEVVGECGPSVVLVTTVERLEGV